MTWRQYLLKKLIGPTCDALERISMLAVAWRVGAPVNILHSVPSSLASPSHFVVLIDELSHEKPSKIIWVESAQKAQDIAFQSLPLLSTCHSYTLSYQESYFRLLQLLLDPSTSWEEGSTCRKEAFDCAERLADYWLDTTADLSTMGLVNPGGLHGGSLAMSDTERKASTSRRNHLGDPS